jgi:signal transduction histidine kinase
VRLADPARLVVVDAVLALGLLAAAQVELWVLRTPTGSRPLIVAVAVLACVPLVLRRRAPLVAVAGAVVSIALPFLLGVRYGFTADSGLFVTLATLFAVHAAAAYSQWRRALAAFCVVLGAQFAVLLTLPVRHSGDYMVLPAVYGAAFVAGRVQSRQRAAMVTQSRQAGEMLLQQQALEQQVRAQERRQIARELHDVIAHGVAVMVVQAGAAEALLDSDPVRARRLLGAVQNSGAQAGTELARLLELLGQNLNNALVPSPRLRDLPELVTDLRAGGLSVRLSEPDLLPSLAPGLELAAYRIVQEALTNVVKHAPRAHADVQITARGDVLEIVVADQGGPSARAREGSRRDGHGLVGMRERVDLYSRTMSAGPTASGFTVRAQLPINAEGGAPSLPVDAAAGR